MTTVLVVIWIFTIAVVTVGLLGVFTTPKDSRGGPG